MRESVNHYYQLIKPGIVYSNTLAAVAGYLFATAWQINYATLLCVFVGVFFIIASACVANNILDSNIDTRMKRTHKRAIVSGAVLKQRALIYAIVLGSIGFTAISFTNELTLVLGIVAYIMYVAVYGYFKRTSIYGTLIGSIPGALPPVAGYTAAAGQLDVAAAILFIILVSWQMPHFYAIAMFRRDDYKSANIPVLPVVRGMRAARYQIIVYIVTILIIAPIMTLLGYAGIVFAILLAGMAGAWLYIGIRSFKLADGLWARRMFFYSLGSLFVICFAIATGTVFV